MDYAEFKTHLATFLWKANDADLIASLDNLIVMGTSELNRRLPIQTRIVTTLLAPDSEDFALPADFRQMISITDATRGGASQMSVSTKAAVLRQRVQTNSAYASGMYCIEKKVLCLAGPYTVTGPGSFTISYRANFPDYKTLDTSYLADDYLDLYTYTVLSHTAPFLREDERVAMWISLKESGITSTNEEDKWNIEFGGSPLSTQPHHLIPQTRR